MFSYREDTSNFFNELDTHIKEELRECFFLLGLICASSEIRNNNLQKFRLCVCVKDCQVNIAFIYFSYEKLLCLKDMILARKDEKG
jgi:hypothetical protein